MIDIGSQRQRICEGPQIIVNLRWVLTLLGRDERSPRISTDASKPGGVSPPALLSALGGARWDALLKP